MHQYTVRRNGYLLILQVLVNAIRDSMYIWRRETVCLRTFHMSDRETNILFTGQKYM